MELIYISQWAAVEGWNKNTKSNRKGCNIVVKGTTHKRGYRCLYVQAYVTCLAVGRGETFTTHRYTFWKEQDRMVNYSFLQKLTANLSFKKPSTNPTLLILDQSLLPIFREEMMMYTWPCCNLVKNTLEYHPCWWIIMCYADIWDDQRDFCHTCTSNNEYFCLQMIRQWHLFLLC